MTSIMQPDAADTEKADEKFLISPLDLQTLLEKKEKFELIDVRSEAEHRLLRLEGARLATRQLVEEIFNKWAKDTPIVLYDHFGRSGLDAARVLAQRGFTHARALRGGIDAWSQDVDPLVPRYP